MQHLINTAETEAADKNHPEAPQDEGVRIGAATRRKEAREAAAADRAMAESQATGRPVTWTRKAAGSGRPIVERIDAGAYTAEDLATLTTRAAGKAAGRAAEGRLVRGGRRVGKVTLSRWEREALAAELCILALEHSPPEASRLPARGHLAEALGDRIAEAQDLAPEARDLAALTAQALAWIATPDKGGRDQWRDTAANHRNLDAQAIDKATTAQAERRGPDGRPRRRDLLAEGEAQARHDDMIRPLARRGPLAAEAETALALGPWNANGAAKPRKALRAALTRGRMASADWAGRPEGAASAEAWDKACSDGRPMLTKALRDPARRRPYAEALADLAEAAEGRPALSREARANGPESTGRTMATPSPRTAKAADRKAREAAALSAALSARYPAQARRDREATRRPAPPTWGPTERAEAQAKAAADRAAQALADPARPGRVLALAEARRKGRVLADLRADLARRKARPMTAAERAETEARWAADLARWAEADRA